MITDIFRIICISYSMLCIFRVLFAIAFKSQESGIHWWCKLEAMPSQHRSQMWDRKRSRTCWLTVAHFQRMALLETVQCGARRCSPETGSHGSGGAFSRVLPNSVYASMNGTIPLSEVHAWCGGSRGTAAQPDDCVLTPAVSISAGTFPVLNA